MRIFRGIGDRLGGRYRLKQRVHGYRAHLLIEKALAENAFDEPRLVEYLRKWSALLAKRKKVFDLAFWFGSSMSRKLLGVSKDGMSDQGAFLYDWVKPWYDGGNGVFVIRDLRLTPPQNDLDAELFGFLFAELMLPYLMGEGWDDVTKGICGEGPYESGEVRMKPDDVVMDCGANQGFFSVLAARRGCEVYAFEPSAHIRSTYLDRNAALNGVREVVPYALSNKRETLRFYVCKDNLGVSKIVDPDLEKQLAGTATEDFETVETLRIDDFVAERDIKRVDFIKADIEGAERQMLRGAGGVLREFAPKLSICTYHLPDDPEVLRDIILENQPRYKITQGDKKLYAHV